MKKLTKWLKWIDDNLLHITVSLFILAAPLVPKFPVSYVEYTYIRIRYDDFIVAVVYLIFTIQFLRRKVSLNTKFLLLFVIFWAAVFTSFIVGYYVQGTIAVQNIGLLHSLRRVEYMAIFFVASSVLLTEKRLRQYLTLYFIALLIVSFYGLGQKFFQFPSIQSMNPAYSDGRLLFLNPEDRINSTFGGHFDLAAYLTFSIPVTLAFYITKAAKNLRYYLIFLMSLIALLYTAARSSFIAYAGSMSLFLLMTKKFKLWIITILVTAGLMLTTGEMAKRFQQTFQFKTVFVNEQTGQENISQEITTKKLPAGSYKIPLAKKKKAQTTEEELDRIALEQALEEARRSGRKPNVIEIQRRADEISKYINADQVLLCDIACATRLQVEWPRAVAAFLFNPVFGSGPSSITEATDNDFLRWLGEMGLFGTLSFLFLLFSLSRFVWKAADKDKVWTFIYKGFVFGLIALLINSLYVDVFEASKVAYNFWLVAGLIVGFITQQHAKKTTK